MSDAPVALPFSWTSLGELAEKSLPTLNEILQGCTTSGAFCLGLICHMAWQDCIEPPRTLLETAANCSSVEQAAEIYQGFTEQREKFLEETAG